MNKKIISELNTLLEFCLRHNDPEGAQVALKYILVITPLNILMDHCDVDCDLVVHREFDNSYGNRIITYYIKEGDKKEKILSWGDPNNIERAYLNS